MNPVAVAVAVAVVAPMVAVVVTAVVAATVAIPAASRPRRSAAHLAGYTPLLYRQYPAPRPSRRLPPASWLGLDDARCEQQLRISPSPPCESVRVRWSLMDCV